jgi:hypothetical protein
MVLETIKSYRDDDYIQLSLEDYCLALVKKVRDHTRTVADAVPVPSDAELFAMAQRICEGNNDAWRMLFEVRDRTRAATLAEAASR